MLFLAATTVGSAVLAWRQYSELVELRAANLNRDERADLQKRIWDLEKLNRELQDQLAAQRDPAADLEKALAGSDAERPSSGRGDRGPGGPRGGRGDPRDFASGAMQQMNAVRDLMNKPEVQAMMSLQQKAAIEQRYAALFKNLNLAPEQIEKLKSLLAERANTQMDVMSAAREQGINPRENPEAFRKLLTDANNQINAGIKSAIGEQGFTQLTNYEQTLPQRNLVNDLQARLSYSNAPLTSAQAEQLVQILAANSPPRQERTPNMTPPGGSTSTDQPGGGRGDGGRGPSGFGPPGGPGGRGPDLGGLVASVMGGGPGLGPLLGGPDAGRGGPTAIVTPAAVNQAQTVLTPPQLGALQQIQQQQQTQQQLRQLINDTLSANQPQAPKAGASAPSGTPPPRKRPGGE